VNLPAPPSELPATRGDTFWYSSSFRQEFLHCLPSQKLFKFSFPSSFTEFRWESILSICEMLRVVAGIPGMSLISSKAPAVAEGKNTKEMLHIRRKLVRLIWDLRWLVALVQHMRSMKMKSRCKGPSARPSARSSTSSNVSGAPTPCISDSTIPPVPMSCTPSSVSPVSCAPSALPLVGCLQGPVQRQTRCQIRRTQSQSFTVDSRCMKEVNFSLSSRKSSDTSCAHECWYCSGELDAAGEIFMYRDLIFCSEECRESQMHIDRTKRTLMKAISESNLLPSSVISG